MILHDDSRKTVAVIAVEAVEREAGVTDVGVESQEGLGEFQGRFLVLVVAQPRPSFHWPV